MRINPLHTLLRPLLLWAVILTYFAMGDAQVHRLVALYLP